MTGVSIVWQMLANYPPILDQVAQGSIVAGIVPQGASLPALGVMQVSSIDRNIPTPGTVRRVADRVQVSAFAGSYGEMRALLALAKQACADRMPAFDFLSEITVHSDGQGPDFMHEDGSLYIGTQDFRVSYNEPC